MDGWHSLLRSKGFLQIPVDHLYAMRRSWSTTSEEADPSNSRTRLLSPDESDFGKQA